MGSEASLLILNHKYLQNYLKLSFYGHIFYLFIIAIFNYIIVLCKYQPDLMFSLPAFLIIVKNKKSKKIINGNN